MFHSLLFAESDPFYEGFAFGVVVCAVGVYLYLAIKGRPSAMVALRWEFGSWDSSCNRGIRQKRILPLA